MSCYLGLDIGTTTITSLLLETGSGEVLSRATVKSEGEITPAPFRARGWSEWDAEALFRAASRSIHLALSRSSSRPEAVRAIGVTGQMHGVLLVSQRLEPLTPFIGWQDQRCNEPIPGANETWLQRFRERAGAGVFRDAGCQPATGYMGPTLFWLRENGKWPSLPCKGCFIADYVVARLIGRSPVTDPTDAGSSALFDSRARQWNFEAIRRLGIPFDCLPEIVESGEIVGEVTAEAALATGLKPGTPVGCAWGDNQASFAGSVPNPAESLLVNVGTGAQVSVLSKGFRSLEEIETRCFPDGYLLVGAALCGGHAYAVLRDFFHRVGEDFFGARGEEGLYERMNSLAASVPSGAEGLRCEPFFTGTRADPSRRAEFTGLAPGNFTPGHLARAVLEGSARELRRLYQLIEKEGEGGRTCLVGSGNGIRQNPLLAEILSEAFGLELHTPAHEEEAAFGAALLASVRAGEFASLSSAGKLIRLIPASSARER